MKKGIIFDLDGVLLSTDKYHYEAWKALADHYGIYFDEKINDRLRGVSRMASLEIVLEKSEKSFSEAEKEDMAEEKNAIYRRLLSSMKPSDVDDEVRETLISLKKMGISLSIGSSSKNTPLILEKTEMAKYFDAVSDGNNITHSKPDPEVFLLAAQYLHLKPEECLVVEDAESGIIAGKRGGFLTIGIGDSAIGCDIKIRKISDLIDVVRN